MALIICPECQAQVSPRARSCPKCGEPIKVWRRRILYGGAGFVGCLILIILLPLFIILLEMILNYIDARTALWW